MVNAVTPRAQTIRWTEAERNLVLDRAYTLMMNSRSTPFQAIKDAQNILPASRQRALNAASSVVDLTAELKKRLYSGALPQGAPASAPAPAPAPTVMRELTIDELVNALASKIAQQVAAQVKRQLLEVDNEFRVGKHDPSYGSARKSKPRVIVIGLLGDQVHNIDHEFGSVFDLKFIDTDRASGLTPPDADAYLLMKNFINHPLYHKYRDFPNHVLIDGGMTSLRTWFHKTANELIAKTNQDATRH
jgi:hypothetical protein